MVGVSGRQQFRRRVLLQTRAVAGRADEEVAVSGRAVRLWQANVSGQAVRRTGTTNRPGKGTWNGSLFCAMTYFDWMHTKV